MYVGELSVGTIIFHARWGLGRVSRRDEACVIAKFGTRRHKLAYNDRVAVWAVAEVSTQVNTPNMRVAA